MRRTGKISAAAVLVTALAAGCGQATAGTAVPNTTDAAAYVSGKFSAKLQELSDDFTGTEDRKSTLDTFARIDDKRADSTLTAIKFGRPAARVVKDHSNRDPNSFLDSYQPSDSDAEYLQLGPKYTSLVPTPWVSVPSDPTYGGECTWRGYQDVCKMLDAVGDSITNTKAAKTAKSSADGSVELSAEITLDSFLENRVVVFPDDLLGRVTPEMKKETIPTKIVLDPAGKLRQIEMTGKIPGGGHEVEIRMNYQVVEPPTEYDLPKLPDQADVTVLPDKAAANDFYDRMAAVPAG